MDWIQLRKATATYILLITFSWTIGFSCLADDSISQPDPGLKTTNSVSHEGGPVGEKLPDIIAKTYTFRVEKRSHSNRIYIFEDPENHEDLLPNDTRAEGLPRVGETLLLKEERNPIMGFRVLKVYPDRNQIAVKRIKRYKKHPPLKAGQIFTGIEKIADYLSFDLTHEEEDELAELEAEKQDKKEEEEEKKRKSAQAKKKAEEEAKAVTENNKPQEGLEVTGDIRADVRDEEDDAGEGFIEEGSIMDPYRHWLSAGFGFTINKIPPSSGNSGSTLYSAGNFRYGYTFAKYIVFNKPNIQDSLTLEGGAFYYKINTYISGYTLLSYIGDLRYNMFFSEKIALFLYGGIIHPVLLSSTNAQTGDAQALTGTTLDGGLGLLFQIGPSWYTRVEAGLYMINLNIVVRF